MIAVTSFSPAGFELYGRKCLTSLVKHFPGKIVVYDEGKTDFHDEKVEFRSLFSIPTIQAYLDRIAKHPGADGKTPNGYDYRYDANKFCRKVFAQDAVFDEDEYVFWFDADTVALQDIPAKFLQALVSEHALAYLGRAQSYTETGFLAFNTKKEDFQRFRDAYLNYFLSGRIFSQLKGWHDCIAFDEARKGVSGRNLSPDGQGVGNVMGMTVLAPYLVHNKGNRKFR